MTTGDAGPAPCIYGKGMRLTPYREALAEAGRLRQVDVGDGRLCVADLGAGPPVLFLHGLAGSLSEWRHQLGPVCARRRVVAPDLLGAGESDKPVRGDYSIEAQAGRVRALLDALRLHRVEVVASSYGGGVALRLAVDHPERVSRMVLVAPVCYRERLPWFAAGCRLPGAAAVAEALRVPAWAAPVARRLSVHLAAATDDELQGLFDEINACGTRAAMVRWVRGALRSDARSVQAGLRHMRAPTLLIWGRQDPIVPVELGRRLARALPEGRLVELDGGHVPHLERPDDVLREMRGFLRLS